MKSNYPDILVIAGYDPSGGAGVLADVKTAGSHGVYAYAICTGYTFQNSRRVSHIQWFSVEAICRQIALCYEDRNFDWVKLGITRNPGMLKSIAACLKNLQPQVRIVWDPVLSASDGTPFMRRMGAAEFEAVLPLVYLVTPNLPEINGLYPGKSPDEVCSRLSEKTIVYLKGGHDQDHPGRDRLFIGGAGYTLFPGTTPVFAKHGSGCVLSTALTANLARAGDRMQIGDREQVPGRELVAERLLEAERMSTGNQTLIADRVLEAATESKRYTEQFLGSDPGLLGWHEPIRK